MPYYPKSQIKTNLYTSGREYSLIPPNPLSIQTSYIGYYYKLSDGRVYTSKNPTDGAHQRLYLIGDNINNTPIENQINPDFDTIELNLDQPTSQYNNIPKITLFKSRLLPSYNPTTPTQTDYELGVLTRYFCKKNNELRYIEIDKKTSDRLSAKSPNIAWDLYSPISTLWYITGDKTTVAKANKGLINLIETQQKWYGFPQYFKDQYLKYYQSLDISNLYTSGGEFKTQNGQNYIGFYHIHNGTIPMIGKTHTNKIHEVLIPILKPIIQQTTQTIPNTPPYSIPSGGGSSTGGGGSY